MTSLERTLGERIYAMRVTRGFRSARELAARMTELGLETSRKQIADWERGATKPDAFQLAYLSTALKMQMEFLLFGGREDEGGDSEFIANLRGLEGALDPRAKRTILALAQQQVRDIEEERQESASGRLTPRQRRLAERGDVDTED